MSNNDPKLCSTKDYNQPVCTPTSTSVWYNDTYNIITWDITNGLYFYYEKLNLYFYYRENYIFYETVNFKNISANKGYYSLLVDKNWFPKNQYNENNITLDYSLLLVGNDIDPYKEINDRTSKWKRVDFKLNSNNTYINKTVTQDSSNNIKNNLKMDVWKIIIISICCFLIIVILLILIKIILFKKKQKTINKNNEINEIIIDKGFQKPDEIDNYNK